MTPASSLVLWSLLFATPAADDKPSLVVVDLEAKGATAVQAEAATLAVLKGLRALDVFQVLGSNDMRTLLSIERQRQLLGAGEGAGSALADLQRALGAKHMVAGSISVLGSALQVELRLLDTATTRVLSQKTLGPVRGIEDVSAQLPGLSQELVGPLLLAQQGSLLVRCREEAAEVVVDDVVVGSTPQRDAVRLPRGTHRLQVRRDGFIAQTRSVVIRPGQVTVEELTLVPSPDYAEAYRQRHGRLRIGAYLTTGLAVLALGGAVYVDRGLTEPTYRRDFLPRQAALNGRLLDELTPPELAADPDFVSAYGACGQNPSACAEEVGRLQQQLSTQQWVTGGLVAVGAASGLVAAYLWLTGEDPNRYANLVAAVGPQGTPTLVLAGRF